MPTVEQEIKKAQDKYVAPKPSIGRVVVWFSGPGRQARVYPAIVTETTDRNTISILVITPTGHMKTVRGTWHISDPALKLRDHQVQTSQGCWDFVKDESDSEAVLKSLVERVCSLEQALEKLLDATPGRPEPSPRHEESEIDREILTLSASGMQSTEIAEKLRCTVQKVCAVLRRKG
jgi:hypothetical protein